MKNNLDEKKLLEYIGQVGDDLIAESETAMLNTPRRKPYAWLSMAAVFVLGLVVAGMFLLNPDMRVRRISREDSAYNGFLTADEQLVGMGVTESIAPPNDAPGISAPTVPSPGTYGMPAPTVPNIGTPFGMPAPAEPPPDMPGMPAPTPLPATAPPAPAAGAVEPEAVLEDADDSFDVGARAAIPGDDDGILGGFGVATEEAADDDADRAGEMWADDDADTAGEMWVEFDDADTAGEMWADDGTDGMGEALDTDYICPHCGEVHCPYPQMAVRQADIPVRFYIEGEPTEDVLFTVDLEHMLHLFGQGFNNGTLELRTDEPLYDVTVLELAKTFIPGQPFYSVIYTVNWSYALGHAYWPPGVTLTLTGLPAIGEFNIGLYPWFALSFRDSTGEQYYVSIRENFNGYCMPLFFVRLDNHLIIHP